MGRRLRRILVQAPRDFLEEFDRDTGSLHASQNEAVRAGMIMAWEEVKKRRGRYDGRGPAHHSRAREVSCNCDNNDENHGGLPRVEV